MTVTLTHAGVAIAVEGPEDEVTWLTGFLAPAFVSDEAATPDVRVRVEVGGPPDGHDGAGIERVAFVLDSGPLRLRGVASGDVIWHRDDVFGARLVVHANRPEAGVQYADARMGRMALMRVVREYAHNRWLAGGGLILHAAAVGTPRGVVGIAGPKGAGKTTLLLRLLAGAGAAYVSNDRLAVGPETGCVLGVPTVVAIRSGTRALAPEIAARLGTAGDFRDLEVTRAAPPPGAPASRGEVWYLSPPQLAAGLPCPIAASGTLAALLVLTSRGGGGTRLRRLDAGEAEAALKEAVLGRRSGCYTSEVFSLGGSVGEEAIAARCRLLSSRVPCFETSAAASPDAFDLRRMLEAVT